MSTNKTFCGGVAHLARLSSIPLDLEWAQEQVVKVPEVALTELSDIDGYCNRGQV